MKEITLKSGTVLKLGTIPFAEAKALYQAVLSVGKDVTFNTKQDYAAIVKDVFCFGFSSPKVDACLAVCFSRCLYNGLKIEDSLFEDEKAREDYIEVCMEVAEYALAPFLKGLYAKLNLVISMMQNIQL